MLSSEGLLSPRPVRRRLSWSVARASCIGIIQALFYKRCVSFVRRSGRLWRYTTCRTCPRGFRSLWDTWWLHRLGSHFSNSSLTSGCKPWSQSACCTAISKFLEFFRRQSTWKWPHLKESCPKTISSQIACTTSIETYSLLQNCYTFEWVFHVEVAIRLP